MMLEAQQIGQHFGANFRVDVERRINGAAGVGAHRTSMLQDLDKRRPLEIDALLTSVQEMGHLANVKTPYIDTVLALVQQMGRSNGVYPTFPDEVRLRKRPRPDPILRVADCTRRALSLRLPVFARMSCRIYLFAA